MWKIRVYLQFFLISILLFCDNPKTDSNQIQTLNNFIDGQLILAIILVELIAKLVRSNDFKRFQVVSSAIRIDYESCNDFLPFISIFNHNCCCRSH